MRRNCLGRILWRWLNHWIHFHCPKHQDWLLSITWDSFLRLQGLAGSDDTLPLCFILLNDHWRNYNCSGQALFNHNLKNYGELNHKHLKRSNSPVFPHCSVLTFFYLPLVSNVIHHSCLFILFLYLLALAGIPGLWRTFWNLMLHYLTNRGHCWTI